MYIELQSLRRSLLYKEYSTIINERKSRQVVLSTKSQVAAGHGDSTPIGSLDSTHIPFQDIYISHLAEKQSFELQPNMSSSSLSRLQL